jgi:hypothetical protein
VGETLWSDFPSRDEGLYTIVFNKRIIQKNFYNIV